MARHGLVCLILAVIFAVQVMADKSDHELSQPNHLEINVVQKGVMSSRVADQPVPSAASAPSEAKEDESSEVAGAPANRRLGKHEHRSDKSVAGGGVIIGGLVTAIFAAVFCYIRVTRKRDGV
ncbi:hypothetical protein FNV43_RR13461 [Rhamnella rubrinervis]|uniref:Transmembrane protein n=1 Tax=Rhamnella rubrinervis TaxID=2594499 RepID=A0A8K0H137_9ROSA|nr:hypothetical protein FNV43_RR13461 [Rhamnella rubrinervis]